MERRSPAVCKVSDHKEGKDEMTKASIDLQDLRRRIYVKAKAETSWKFWGLYVHVCKLETLREAYALAKTNDGAPGSDGVTFEAVEAQGVEAFLEQIADELVGRSYAPLPARRAGAENVAWPRWCDTRRRKSEPTGNTNFGLNRRVSPRPYR